MGMGVQVVPPTNLPYKWGSRLVPFIGFGNAQHHSGVPHFEAARCEIQCEGTVLRDEQKGAAMA